MPIAIEMKPVENSSQVESAGYHAESQTFAVRFKRTAAVYHYKAVPAEVAHAFDEADSKGRFIGEQIKGVFEFEKVPDTAGQPA